MKVFVYGTLRKGYGNHHLLRDANFLGEAQVKATMYLMGYIPYVSLNNDTNTVHGEVYKIDEDILRRLDQLEGYYPSQPNTSFYNRSVIKTIDGHEAYIYHIEYKEEKEQYKVSSGDWKIYTQERDAQR